MYHNKNKRNYMDVVRKNNTQINTGYTVIAAILELVKEKKSAKGNTYYFCKATTLNRAGQFIQYEQKLNRETREKVPFDPPTKRAKITNDETGETTEQDVLDDKLVVKREEDNTYGYMLQPGSSIMFNTFDRTINNLTAGTVCKLALIADLYQSDVSFKVSSVITDADPSLSSRLYKKYITGSPLAEIPTVHNIDPKSFPVSTDPKYYARAFVLPLSDDTRDFRDVNIALDCEDPDRFFGRVKEPAKFYKGINDPETKLVSVNTGSGDKIANNLSVVFTGANNKTTYCKFGYMPNVWECFGITDVSQWSKSAGRMIFNAKDWFVYGTSRLADIKSMAANADADDGYDFGGAITCDAGDDGGYGGYGDFEDANGEFNTDSAPDTSRDDVDFNTTGFIHSMSLNLTSTVKASGIELPRDYVEEIMARGKYKFVANPEIRPDNKLNNGWMMRVERRERGVYNVTELDELSRQPFLEDTRGISNLKFFGIFPVGDDGPYEHVQGDDHDIATYARDNKVTPSTIYAVIE